MLKAPGWKMAALREMIREEIWKKTGCDELQYPLDFIVADTADLYGPEEAINILHQSRDQNDYLFIRLDRHRALEDIEQLLALRKITR
jgi:lysozyme family protein